MGFDNFEVIEPEDPTIKLREKVADLMPLAEKIAAETNAVRLTIETEGANGEIDRLRTAARLSGFSLRISERKVSGKVTKIVVKAGKLIERNADGSAGDEEPDAEPEIVSE